ncbi:hypothetical protein [Kitasatospora sp. NPDC093102]|uniref:hypothetical protein n=1 Tax=Kitasatospora sp. NPDC093102 TaxID=3155069 RepID=UPI003428C2D0
MLTGAAAYLAVQLWHTFRDRNTWPFCAYNMFTYDLPERWHQLRVVLYDADGHAHGPADPWCLLPVEFFRVVSMMQRFFLGSEDQALRARFCARTLDLINESGWKGFDEVRAAPVSPTGAPFRALDVYLVEVDDACDAVDRASVRSAELLHRHDPQGIAGGRSVQWSVHEK